MRKALVSALAIGAALCGAPARGEDNPACAKYQQPLAYNACLARLGPHARGVHSIPDGQADSPPVSSEAPAPRQRRGRSRAEFDVGRDRHSRD
jgi:hypothetical protein